MNRGDKAGSTTPTRLAALLVLAGAASGCGVLRQAEDQGIYTVSAEALLITPAMLQGVEPAPAGATAAALQTALAPGADNSSKKQFLGMVIFDSEQKCATFLNRLTVAQNGLNATGDVLTTVLSGIATAVSPVGVSHAFSAASTIIGGSKAAIAQDVWAKAGIQDYQKALAGSYYSSIKAYTDRLEEKTTPILVPIEVTRIQSIHTLCTLSAARNVIDTTLSTTGQGNPPPVKSAKSGVTEGAIPGLSLQQYLAPALVMPKSAIEGAAIRVPGEGSFTFRRDRDVQRSLVTLNRAVFRLTDPAALRAVAAAVGLEPSATDTPAHLNALIRRRIRDIATRPGTTKAEMDALVTKLDPFLTPKP